MAVVRVEKTKDYTVMSNYHLKEKNMSLKAKGLLSLMLSLPDNWDYTISGLTAICKENVTAIKNILNELKDFGYLEIIKKQNNKGQFEYIYNIYEKPQNKKPEMENLEVDNPEVDNQGQLNTKELNTKESSTNKNINKKEKNNKKKTFEEFFKENNISIELKNTLQDFIDMRKTIKKPMTTRALELLVKQLNKLSNDEQTQIAILNQSIVHGWQSVYELKDKTQIEKKEQKTYDMSRLTDEEYTQLFENKITIEELIKKGKIDAI